jgi:hypothetical protein
MDLSRILQAVEDSQTAKLNGASKQAMDQAKADAIAVTIAQDAADQVALVTAADAAIDAAITVLQSLKSTATSPVQ